MNQPSILVIEGDASVAKLLCDVFTDRGWNVDVCRDGDCAIEALNDKRPCDVVLVSYVVPDTSGVILVRLIRSLAHRRHTPVVMMTGSGNVDEEALAAGVDEIWHKPLDLLQFIAAIEKYAFVTIQRETNIVA